MQSDDIYQTSFDFTSDDLPCNRAGAMSRRQADALRSSARASAPVIIVVVGAFFALTTYGLVALISLLISAAQDIQLGFVLPFFIFVPILGIIWLVLGNLGLNAMRDLISAPIPKIDHATGAIVRGNKTSSGAHEIEIGGKAFTVTPAVYQSIDPATVYTVYFTRTDSKIVSMEENGRDFAGVEKSPQVYETEQLQRVFKFSAEDLAANQSGKISTAQTMRMKREGRNSEFGCFIFMALVLTGGVFGGTIGITLNFPVAVGSVLIVWALLAVITFRRNSKEQRAISKLRLHSVSGTASVQITTHRTTGEHPTTVTSYFVSLDSTKFKLEEEAYYCFKEGRPYQAYFVALPTVGRTIISMAPVR